MRVCVFTWNRVIIRELCVSIVAVEGAESKVNRRRNEHLQNKRGKFSAFFRYVDANEHRCCVANERGQFYWLTTNKSTTNVAISANSQDHCSCKCSSCLHPYRYSLHTRLYIYRIVACFIMLVEVKRAFAASLESRTCRYSRVTG